MASDVAELVDSVLDRVPEPLSSCCDRAAILSGLDAAGACSVPMLRTLMEEDYDEVKQALAVPVAKAAFVAALKQGQVRVGRPLLRLRAARRPRREADTVWRHRRAADV